MFDDASREVILNFDSHLNQLVEMVRTHFKDTQYPGENPAIKRYIIHVYTCIIYYTCTSRKQNFKTNQPSTRHTGLYTCTWTLEMHTFHSSEHHHTCTYMYVHVHVHVHVYTCMYMDIEPSLLTCCMGIVDSTKR